MKVLAFTLALVAVTVTGASVNGWKSLSVDTLAGSVVEPLEKMRRRVLADFAAEPGTHLGAVAPVHPAPHPRVAFLGMDLCDARVVTNRAGVSFERQWELIGLEPFRVERERARTDGRVSGGVFGVGRRGDEGCPRRIRVGLVVAIGIAGLNGCHWAPEHVRVLRIPNRD